MPSGILYICPTPIGNLKDITFRAIEILNNVDLILCEDTRTSQKLLNHYKIKTKTKSHHKFNEKQSSPEIVRLLVEGQNIALISDAGTPIISDPGSELIKTAVENDIKIIPLAGASALTTFMSGVYNPCGQFLFAGFLPKKTAEKELFLKANKHSTIVFYESPNRLVKTLEEIYGLFPQAQVAVGRELTKLYEEIKQSSIKEILNYYTQNQPKGEIAVAIMAQKQEQDETDYDEKIVKLANSGYGINDISKILSSLFGASKKDIYKKALILAKK